MQVDIVHQATGFHSWNVSEGWSRVLDEMGILNYTFRPRGKWGDTLPENDDGLYQYLPKAKTDLFLLLGFDWHSMPLFQVEKWINQWKKSKVPKWVYVQESIIHAAEKFNNFKNIENLELIKEFIDGFIYTDFNDKSFFLKLGKKSIYMPFGVDTKVFYSQRKLSERLKKSFFRGKTTPFFSNETYKERRNYIDQMEKNDNFDLINYQNHDYSVDKLVSEYNNYLVAINFPSIFSSHPTRVTEALACGNIVLTNATNIKEINEQFDHKENLLYYSSIDELEKILHEIILNPEEYYSISEKGIDLVHSKYCLEKQINRILTLI